MKWNKTLIINNYTSLSGSVWKSGFRAEVQPASSCLRDTP